MDFTKPLNQSAEPDFTKPATPEVEELEDEEQPDFSQPIKATATKAKPTPAPKLEGEGEDEERPKRTQRKRAHNTEPKHSNYIRTINTADWKQQQADHFKRSYLGF